MTFKIKEIIPYVLLVAAVTALFLYGKNQLTAVKYDYEAQATQLKKLHAEEVQKINAARDKEKQQLEENIKVLEDSLAKNKVDYEKKIKDLEEKRKNEVSSFVSKHGDNPVSMAREISATTGFKVYDPKAVK